MFASHECRVLANVVFLFTCSFVLTASRNPWELMLSSVRDAAPAAAPTTAPGPASTLGPAAPVKTVASDGRECRTRELVWAQTPSAVHLRLLRIRFEMMCDYPSRWVQIRLGAVNSD